MDGHQLKIHGCFVNTFHFKWSFFAIWMSLFLGCLCLPLNASRYPDLDPASTHAKFEEIMKYHATTKSLNPETVKRGLNLYLEELDPGKTYFIQSDIDTWLNPSDALIQRILNDYNARDFHEFETIHQKMIQAIERRHELDKLVLEKDLPKDVDPDEFKDLKWAQNEQELLNRLIKIKGLQQEALIKLKPEQREKSEQRIAKRQAKYEEELLINDPTKQQRLILSNFLKAFAGALDSQTAYFTPEEASQFMINVQQRLFGIGAQLRDDINGFTVTKIVEGSPASTSKLLKLKDRIIAINGEPVVGMDILDAVEIIRGEANTPVTLTIVRETAEEGEPAKEETLDVTLLRGEVVLKESRYEISYEPFGDGIIVYLKLFSFYQDPDSSSAADLARELNHLKETHKVNGVILDLRFNGGGMLTQAVAVTGLFITKGIVVSIKDDEGSVQHLRDIDGKTVWNGPLVVLINRGSASASEIVAQTLQDYGRAIIMGDDHSFGKGSFQTFTLTTGKQINVNPQGEYKVTRGRYYTVSGKSPQMVGVASDIVIPGPLSESDIGEKFGKYPLETDSIAPNFEDDLSDVPFAQRARIASLYKFKLQPKLHIYQPYMETLKQNSRTRLEQNKNFQNFLKELKKKKKSEVEEEFPFGQNDLQLTEAYNVLKDLILLMRLSAVDFPPSEAA